MESPGDGASACRSACSWRNDAFERSEREDDDRRCSDDMPTQRVCFGNGCYKSRPTGGRRRQAGHRLAYSFKLMMDGHTTPTAVLKAGANDLARNQRYRSRPHPPTSHSRNNRPSSSHSSTSLGVCTNLSALRSRPTHRTAAWARPVCAHLPRRSAPLGAMIIDPPAISSARTRERERESNRHHRSSACACICTGPRRSRRRSTRRRPRA